MFGGACDEEIAFYDELADNESADAGAGQTLPAQERLSA
jgi:hypothetical protein